MLENPFNYDNLDRDVSAKLKTVDPMSAGLTSAPPDFWTFLFTRCRVTETDILITIVYKLGLIRTAETLAGKNLIDRGRYLVAKSRVRDVQHM